MNDSFRQYVALLVAQAEAEATGRLERITIDVQDSGEFPYRVEVTGEQYPVVGVATVADMS